MNVCVLTHTFPRNKEDSAAAFMKEFCDGLVEAGAKVSVVIPYDLKLNRKTDKFKIITYKYIWPTFFHLLGYSRTMSKDVSLRKRAYFLLPLMLVFGTLALYRTVRKEKIDIINVHWILPNGLMALVVSFLTRVPYVITLPGTDVYLAYRYKIFGFVARIIAQRASGIISNSSWHLNRILGIGIRDVKTAVYGYPVDILHFKPINRGFDSYRKMYGLRNDDFIILAVGRLVYKKGYEYLIKAMPKLIKKHPETKLIIGGDGDLRHELENLTKRMKVSSNVIFVGDIPRNEIVYYYNLADVMVAPSIIDKEGNMDGGPVASYESMACGKAQIATDVLGVSDIIKDGVNGYKIPQKDVGSIEQALEKLLQSKTLRTKMGDENRRLIIAKFSTGKVGKSYLSFFKTVMHS